MIGNGIGIGFVTSLSGKHGPEWLHTALSTLFGATLIGLWVGEDLVVDGSNNVTSWPGRVGGTLANSTAYRYQGSTLGSRKAATKTTTTVAVLSANLGAAVKSVIAVAEKLSGNFADYNQLFRAGSSSVYLIGNTGTSEWFGAGVQHYNDGVGPTMAIPTGIHVFQGDYTSGTETTIYYGSSAAGTNWLAPAGCLLALSAIPSAANRAAAVVPLKTYYSI